MAARERRMGLTLLVTILILTQNAIESFNIDLKKPYIYTSKETDSYFGYSVALNKHDYSVIIGAPLSSDTNEGTKQWGSVFTCPVRLEESKRACEKLKNVDVEKTTPNVIKEGQWMGASVYSNNGQVLACAPRYKTKDTNGNGNIYLPGKCDHIDTTTTGYLKETNFVLKPCVQLAERLTETQVCQTGFSSRLAGSTDKVIYAGLPNLQLGTGRIATATSKGKQVSFPNGTYLSFSDYMGYSMTTGKLKEDKNTIIIVGGAPRSQDLSGMVLMYDTSPGFPVFSTPIHDPEDQTGSYFGASLAAADIDGDGFSDLVIGAPQFARSGKPNVGRVYVYMNNGKNNLLYAKENKLYGNYRNGFFGYAIGSVGDLNNDAMQDIAVGEPWGGDDGKGVVYLYYGTSNKAEPLILKQVIKPQDIAGGQDFDGFGFSFGEFYPYSSESNPSDLNNLDGIAYNDIIIGSYRSGHAVFLRSREVLTIEGSLETDVKIIDLYNTDSSTTCEFEGISYKCIKGVKICFSMQSPDLLPIDVDYTLTLDSGSDAAKRGFVVAENNQKVSTYKSTFNLTETRQCRDDIDILLKNVTNDIFRPFVFQLDWGFKEPESCQNSLCPIANKMLTLAQTKTIPYVKGCDIIKDDKCQSDLKVTMKAQNQKGEQIKTVAVGVENKVTIVIDVHNDAKAENAFINRLEVVYTKEVMPDKVTISEYEGVPIWEPNVSQDSDISTVGVTLSSPIKPGSSEKVAIEFSVRNVGQGSAITFKATAKTKSDDMNLADNEDELTLDIVVRARFSTSGNVFPDQIKWKASNTDPSIPGPNIRYKFLFQNMGPSAASSSYIKVKIPEKIGDHYILNLKSYQLDGTSKQGLVGSCNNVDLNPLKINANKASSNSTRKRRNVIEPETVDCNGVSCRLIECNLNFIDRNQNAQLILDFTLVEATFENVLKSGRKIEAFAEFRSDVVDVPKDAPNTATVSLTVSSPHLKVEEKGEPIQWWIILLCILGAILIIGLIVFVLYKKGFFKRKKPHGEEEEEENLRKGDPDDDY